MPRSWSLRQGRGFDELRLSKISWRRRIDCEMGWKPNSARPCRRLQDRGTPHLFTFRIEYGHGASKTERTQRVFNCVRNDSMLKGRELCDFPMKQRTSAGNLPSCSQKRVGSMAPPRTSVSAHFYSGWLTQANWDRCRVQRSFCCHQAQWFSRRLVRRFRKY